jgi:hypothetical protein
MATGRDLFSNSNKWLSEEVWTNYLQQFRKSTANDHPTKRHYCQGCGEEKTLRWPSKGRSSLWCSQRCAADIASEILTAAHPKQLFFCAYCGTQGCTKAD